MNENEQTSDPGKIIVGALTGLSERILALNERIGRVEQCLNQQNGINTSTRKCIETLDEKTKLLFRCMEIMKNAVLGALSEDESPEHSAKVMSEIEELKRMFESTEEGAA